MDKQTKQNKTKQNKTNKQTLFASMMALSKPSPSPLSAGPKHSGRRIRRRITRLAFSSTLSPMNTVHGSDYFELSLTYL
jgi:hypothetical protein